MSPRTLAVVAGLVGVALGLFVAGLVLVALRLRARSAGKCK